MHRRSLAILYLFVLVAVVLSVATARAAKLVSGPINAKVVSIYDGDTLTVDAEPWPGVTVRTLVRVDGVDTPEIRGRCEAERDLALRARDFVRGRVGEMVQLTNIRHGKYAGRVVANVLVGRKNLADLIVSRGLGRAYSGGKRRGWCH